MGYKVFIGMLLLSILIAGLSLLMMLSNKAPYDSAIANDNSGVEDIADLPSWVSGSFITDFTMKSIEFNELLDGGPGKDGIPALTNPEFEPIAETAIDPETFGLYLDIDSEQKFYPYNILVWHEIVNDTVGDEDVAVTFCPLCGSAIVYDRGVDGKTLEFKVSGLLRESNMIMYDTDTESFWNQSLGEAVVGDFTGTTLQRLPFQLLSISEVQNKFPNTQIMTTDTGYSRSYDGSPYSGYSDNDSTYFPISVDDKRFPAKEVFYVVSVENSSIAVRTSKLGDTGEFISPELGITLVKDRGEITASRDGETLPGYHEMWFSWATQHEANGQVWEPK